LNENLQKENCTDNFEIWKKIERDRKISKFTGLNIRNPGWWLTGQVPEDHVVVPEMTHAETLIHGHRSINIVHPNVAVVMILGEVLSQTIPETITPLGTISRCTSTGISFLTPVAEG